MLTIQEQIILYRLSTEELWLTIHLGMEALVQKYSMSVHAPVKSGTIVSLLKKDHLMVDPIYKLAARLPYIAKDTKYWSKATEIGRI